MLNAADQGRQPMETFYDGYIVNAIMDACYKSARSKKWEPVNLKIWRGKTAIKGEVSHADFDAEHLLIKEEVMPDGKTKLILKNKKTGEIEQKIMER
jgi:hypothetical protein